MRTVLTAAHLWDGTNLLDDPVVVVEDGLVSSISYRTASGSLPEGEVVSFAGATLAPAFFDVHIHGCAGHDLMEATPQALSAVGRFLATRGVGSYLATTVTASMDETLKSLSGLAKLLSAPQAPGQAVIGNR